MSNQGRKYTSTWGMGILLVTILLLIFKTNVRADDFSFLFGPFKKDYIKPHCDSNGNAYELYVEWLGDSKGWVARQRYCYEEYAICKFLDGEDPKEYCRH